MLAIWNRKCDFTAKYNPVIYTVTQLNTTVSDGLFRNMQINFQTSCFKPTSVSLGKLQRLDVPDLTFDPDVKSGELTELVVCLQLLIRPNLLSDYRMLNDGDCCDSRRKR